MALGKFLSGKPKTAAQPKPAAKAPQRRSAAQQETEVEALFLGAFEPVIVEEPAYFEFDGSLLRKHMRAVWKWIEREIAPDFAVDLSKVLNEGSDPAPVIDKHVPLALEKMKQAVADSQKTADAERRLTVFLGGEEGRARLPIILSAFRCRPLLVKATNFGRASNSLGDDTALASALQSLPLKDPAIASLLLHTVIGQSATPSRLVSAVLTLVSSGSEKSIKNVGFGPLIEGLFAHAQNQISLMSDRHGVFSDMDLMCKTIARFHKLLRSVTGYVELERGTRWAMIAGELTKQMTDRIVPRLREVSGDVSQSLRLPRDGSDFVDSDRLLAALNGMYLLDTLREARESLALNEIFEKVWTEVGQSLEVHLSRNLEMFKQNPASSGTAERLQMGIKMAELRFNAEYAEILRRAVETAEKRGQKSA